MSMRDALGQSRILTLGVLVGMGWLVFTIMQVLGQINYWNPVDVGQTASTGVIGLFVLVAVLLLALTVFSELGYDEPTANTWPPEDTDDAT